MFEKIYNKSGSTENQNSLIFNGDFDLVCLCKKVVNPNKIFEHISDCNFCFYSPIFAQIMDIISEDPFNQYIILQILIRQNDFQMNLGESQYYKQNVISKNNREAMKINLASASKSKIHIPNESSSINEKMCEEYDIPTLLSQNSNNIKSAFNPNSSEIDALINLCVDCYQNINHSPNVTLECRHKMHKFCLEKNIRNNFENNSLCCLQCNMSISNDQVRDIISDDKMYLPMFENKLKTLSMLTGVSLVQCPECLQTAEFHEGSQENINNLMDNQGKHQTDETMTHRRRNRLKCQCGITQCIGCKSIPYHENMTCEMNKLYHLSKKCRYCDRVIDNKNQSGNQSSCSDSNCLELYKTSCKHINSCGHQCQNIDEKDHSKCIDCLNPECNMILNENEYCMICQFDSLGRLPVVKLDCGHIVHQECLVRKMETGQSGPRMYFNFMDCVCKSRIQSSSFSHMPQLFEVILQWEKLQADVDTKGQQRLHMEGLDKCEEYLDPTKEWQLDKSKQALRKLAFQKCHKCLNPQFAGLRECDRNIEESREFKEEELVCGGCIVVEGVGEQDCEVHGKDYIEWKCKFCCSISAWFCWNSTHFCDGCHTKQNKGDYVTLKKIHELPQCGSKINCPLKIEHPQNGEKDYALGCAMCRSDKKK